MTPQEFDELVAWNEIEPMGAMPFHRLLVFITATLMNLFRDEKTKPVEMVTIAELAGLPSEQFKTEDADKFVSPEVASAMFRR